MLAKRRHHWLAAMVGAYLLRCGVCKGVSWGWLVVELLPLLLMMSQQTDDRTAGGQIETPNAPPPPGVEVGRVERRLAAHLPEPQPLGQPRGPPLLLVRRRRRQRAGGQAGGRPQPRVVVARHEGKHKGHPQDRHAGEQRPVARARVGHEPRRHLQHALLRGDALGDGIGGGPRVGASGAEAGRDGGGLGRLLGERVPADGAREVGLAVHQDRCGVVSCVGGGCGDKEG
jgi:hypothetical protein